MMGEITLSTEVVIIVAILSYVGGYVIVRILGGGYVTKSEFNSYKNQNEIDKSALTEKIVSLQKRFNLESFRSREEEEKGGFLNNLFDAFFDKMFSYFADYFAKRK